MEIFPPLELTIDTAWVWHRFQARCLSVRGGGKRTRRVKEGGGWLGGGGGWFARVGTNRHIPLQPFVG